MVRMTCIKSEIFALTNPTPAVFFNFFLPETGLLFIVGGGIRSIEQSIYQ